MAFYTDSVLEKFKVDETELALEDIYGERVLGRRKERDELLSSIPNPDFDDILILGNFQGILLYGPQGSGKSYLLRAYRGSLSRRAYDMYTIDCSDMIRQPDYASILKLIFEELQIRTDPEGEYQDRIYVQLDHLNACFGQKACIELMKSYMEELDDADCVCIIAAEIEDIDAVPAVLFEKMLPIEAALPDMEDRTEYFKANFPFEMENPDNEEETFTFSPLTFDMDTFAQFCAEETEDLNYSEMDKVMLLTKRLLKSKLSKNVNLLDEMFAQFMNPKGVRVDEDEFRTIVKRVKTTSRIARSAKQKAENEDQKTQSSTNAAAPIIVQVPMVQAQPQIVYAQAPTAYNYSGAFSQASVNNSAMGNGSRYNGAGNSPAGSFEDLLNRADSENPTTGDLMAAYAGLPRNQQNQEN